MKLTDEQCDLLDDAIEDALLKHYPLDNNGHEVDTACKCGARNNMDGDELHGHRLGVLSQAVHGVLVDL
jgi:hypothetical protein